MTVAAWIFGAYALAGSFYWLLNAYSAARVICGVPSLEDLAPPDPPAWPKVSLIIPACNEVDTLEAAVASRLRDDYPDLEVVLIDDRSSDGTGENRRPHRGCRSPRQGAAHHRAAGRLARQGPRDAPR